MQNTQHLLVGTSNIPISKWNILVNSQSIKDNSDISAVLTPFFHGNANIAANIIAPTAEGYFDLDFNFTGTDVSFSYNINTIVDPNSPVSDLVATGYQVDNGPIITFSDNTTITNTIRLADNIQTKKYRIYVKWKDDGTATMTNAQDTASAIAENNNAIFDVNVNFTQVTE